MPRCYHSSVSCHHLHLCFSYYLYNHVDQLDVSHHKYHTLSFVCSSVNYDLLILAYNTHNTTFFERRIYFFLLRTSSYTLDIYPSHDYFDRDSKHPLISHSSPLLQPGMSSTAVVYLELPFSLHIHSRHLWKIMDHLLMLPHHQQNELNLQNLALSNFSF